ncbi:MAG: tRNA uridine-5-carboxymethylaminomethyl(34) synthesis enzyme MnmG, partial [Sphaerochaetaceae bacterium]
MDFDTIVIGGGHAGIEACLAPARMGFKTLLITQNLDAIGRLSCNPAIGGLAKGNIVREIDALGGEMGHLIDSTMIQYRILNRRRGPAVQSPRAQADKFEYSALAKRTVELQPNLSLFMDTVVDLIIDEDTKIVSGVITERGHKITSKTVVLTTGTFMEGRIFIGEYDSPCGRLGEVAAIGLGTNLRKHGFTLGRMKTGTPARIKKSSIDFSKCEEQPGDDPMPFSFDYESVDRPSIPCFITWTNDKTHEIIRKNIQKSPLYGGKIVGKGPRYCPSIEDKVVRFPDRERHQIFIEPEGANTEEMYLNGLSSSLPEDVQNAFMRTLPGLENAEVMRPAYAVEYDYIDPLQLLPSLECINNRGLFIAGQTNGTSGYEEAACQGLIAGINAAQKLKGEEP